MSKLTFADTVFERDIDRLLMEELECNTAFRKWFLKKIGIHGRTKVQTPAIGHSVTDSELGESDLVLLIESKSMGIHCSDWSC